MMRIQSVKSKIVMVGIGFVVLSGVMYGYIFPWLDRANTSLAESVKATRKEFLEVEAEQRNFELGKRDLATLASKPIRPDNLFSGDTSLVTEIEILEQVAEDLELSLDITVSGTAATAPKAKTSTDIRTIPFAVHIEGTYSSVIHFLEFLEHAKFVTYIKTLNIAPSKDGTSFVGAQLSGNFYIKK